MKIKIVVTLVNAIICLNCTLLYAQVSFSDIYLEPDTILSGKFKNYEAYDLGYMTLYKKSKKAEEIIVVDKSTDTELFSFSNSMPKAEFKKPRFFQSDQIDQPIIMLLDVSGNYSLGVQVFLIEENQIYDCGFLAYAVDNYNFSSLALYTHFVLTEDKIILTFDDDINIIDNNAEQLIEGNDLKFEIYDYQIKRIQD